MSRLVDDCSFQTVTDWLTKIGIKSREPMPLIHDVFITHLCRVQLVKLEKNFGSLLKKVIVIFIYYNDHSK